MPPVAKKSSEIDPRQIEYLPLAALEPDDRNPKAHDEDMINQSINRFGVLDLIVKDERTGKIISGHGRRKAFLSMYEAGESAPDGVKVDEDGMWLVPVVTGWGSRTDTEAAAALIALNRTTELGGWVDESLLDLLQDLSQVDDGLVGVGYEEDDMADLQEALDAANDLDEAFEETGQLLHQIDLTWLEPEHQPERGDVYELGGKHILVVARVHNEYRAFVEYLDGERTFLPYPEPYLLASTIADETPVVAVQPVIFLAGHILDKWASVHGKESIVKLRAGLEQAAS